ncbi:unnamed protein product [Lactuca saligna]|uniref:Uncharacterized protein n=1 Tax=Lactuca saligna TaxID=75948 RepID=A0AA35ZAT5_LACSI|nr:unnamed protein product [Lactuca saligna]
MIIDSSRSINNDLSSFCKHQFRYKSNNHTVPLSNQNQSRNKAEGSSVNWLLSLSDFLCTLKTSYSFRSIKWIIIWISKLPEEKNVEEVEFVTPLSYGSRSGAEALKATTPFHVIFLSCQRERLSEESPNSTENPGTRHAEVTGGVLRVAELQVTIHLTLAESFFFPHSPA